MSVPKCGLAALLVVGLLGGCAAVPSAEPPPLDGTAWVLAALPGRTWTGAPATLRFEGGRAQGSDGCNRYNAPFRAKDSTLEIGPRGVGTMMACAPDVMAQSEAFAAALQGTRAYRVEGGQLRLLGASGAVLATLAPQSRSLAGTRWKVTGLNNGRNALVSTLGESNVTLVFGTDGRASGSAGCNQYTARFAADGSGLRFDTPAATRKLCADPKLMDQEQQFLKALEAVATVSIEGSRLELRDAGGALQVTAARE